MTLDAIVIGAGPNGLAAANLLGDAGWKVLVLEGAAEPGGAVRTAEVTVRGFRHDLYSAFYPLGAVSPVFRALELERWGLRWTHAPLVIAHPFPGGPTGLLSRDEEVTAGALARGDAADGQRYRELIAEWRAVSGPFMESMLSPFPPVRSGARLAWAARHQVGALARRALVPLRRFLDEELVGETAQLLFAGSALHADLSPEQSGSALFGWMMVGLAQEHGFPVPVGGAGELTAALVRRAAAVGVQIVTDAPVSEVVVRAGRAVGVTTRSGDHHHARHVVAACDVTHLLLDLVGREHLSASTVRSVTRVERAPSTFKIDWALSSPVPWTDPAVGDAGTVHLAASVDELTHTAAQLATGLVPADPFVLLGQMTTADPTRSPPGTEVLWAYTHVPQHVRGDAGPDGLTGRWDEGERERFADRVEGRIAELAPGFAERILARRVVAPADLERADANLVGGDISGGTAQLHQQLVLRPVPGWGRAETPIKGLYLGSASAHPGGGVHGAAGANAARAALAHERIDRVLRPLVGRS